MVRCSSLAVVLLAAACTSHWRSQRLDHPTPVNRHDVVLIWSRGVVNKWQAVAFSEDSVSGMPYQRHRRCDSCRRSLPLTEVDSMRREFQYPKIDPKRGLEVAGGVGLLLVIEMAVCKLIGAKNGC
jgi:hypothetical protein